MNDNMRMPPSGSQSEEDIRGVVQEAQRSAMGNPTGWEDEYIDNTMDEENYEENYDDWGPN